MPYIVSFSVGVGLVVTMAIAHPVFAQREGKYLSHPPLRTPPQPVKRKLAASRSYFADARKGSDKNTGARESPWRTIGHALERLQAGDTLYLRGGTFYERVRVALTGARKLPITIRSYPGEQAIVDGGLPEFFQEPATCWRPFPKGGRAEYRSVKRYANLRNVLGSFGDSMIGLQTYYHAQDFRATNEKVDWPDWDKRATGDLKPLWLGPGLWYDKTTGFIHIRLAHTHLPKPIANYRGVTDPRKLPLVIAPFRATPLHIDGAKHIRFRDLIVRGAGYAAVRMDQGFDIQLDNVTIWCGAYGIRSMGTRHLKIERCRLYGNVAPWTFRGDGSKRDYPGRPHRNLSRLNTHALIDINSGRESSIYATPYNDFWEISHSEFTDAHDGVYLGAINVNFHHNLIENMQDDGIYLSPMYFRHRLEKTDPRLYVHHNVIRQVLTALAFGGPQPKTRDTIFIYRNLVDLRAPVQTGRPTAKRATPGSNAGGLVGDHGSPPWSAMNIYHNTFVMARRSRSAGMATLTHTRAGHQRHVFNNIFFHIGALPGYYSPKATDKVVADGNLYWALKISDKKRGASSFFQRFRSSKWFAESKRLYKPGSTRHSLVADPLFRTITASASAKHDYRLQANSPALNAGVLVPKNWPDEWRRQDRGRPDIGAFPAGISQLRSGR